MNIRAATRDDFPAMLELLLEDEEMQFGRASRLGLGDLDGWLGRVDLANDSWLYDEDGRLVALGWTEKEGEGGLSFAIGVVRPGAKGRGLGAQLVQRSEACARERGATRMHQLALGPDAAAASLIVANGYRVVRRFYEMAIELEEPPEAPALVVEVFRAEDAEAFHATLDEAFRDHWEHHGRPFEEWWTGHQAQAGFDPSLWFLIRDGAEIAAVARNDANRNGGGYVGALGVRRPWRGKGYAKALLLHTFREFFDRGSPRITLGVDAQSPTGATHLYERVGMQVEQENVVFEKDLL